MKKVTVYAQHNLPHSPISPLCLSFILCLAHLSCPTLLTVLFTSQEDCPYPRNPGFLFQPPLFYFLHTSTPSVLLVLVDLQRSESQNSTPYINKYQLECEIFLWYYNAVLIYLMLLTLYEEIVTSYETHPIIIKKQTNYYRKKL